MTRSARSTSSVCRSSPSPRRESSSNSSTSERHAPRFRLDAGQRVFGGRRQRRTVLAGQFGIALNRRQRGSQLVAGVGEELPHPQVGIDAMRQRAIHVVQQPVQRVPDDSDFVVRVGVLRPDPDADPVVVAGERHRGDLRGGRGDPAQRAKGVADHPNGERRGDHQCGRDEHAGGDVLAGDDLVGEAQRHPDDQDVGSVDAAVNPVGTQAAQSFGTGRARRATTALRWRG